MDIALIIQQGDFLADIGLLGADLQTDAGLRTAVIASLFSNARAADDDVLPQAGGDLQGWWGDAYAEIPGDVTGGKLWLLARAKELPQTLVSAQAYAQATLAWLIEDGIASAVTVTPFYPELGLLGLLIEIDRPSGQARWVDDFVWRAS